MQYKFEPDNSLVFRITRTDRMYQDAFARLAGLIRAPLRLSQPDSFSQARMDELRRLHGLDVILRTPQGGMRHGEDLGGPWESIATSDYGYVRHGDGSLLGVFIGPHVESELVFLIDQVDMDGRFDQHKALLGFSNRKEAMRTYLANFPDKWRIGGTKERTWRIGGVLAVTMDDFKRWLLLTARRHAPLGRPFHDADL